MNWELRGVLVPKSAGDLGDSEGEKGEDGIGGI